MNRARCVGLMVGLLGLALHGCRPPIGPASAKAPAPERAALAAEAAKPLKTVRAPGAVRHEIAFELKAQRRLQIRSRYPSQRRAEVVVAMPVWIPGSYLLREFARNVIAPRAFDGAGTPLEMRKISKNRMKISTGGADVVELRYELYANEMTVRTSFVGPEYAVINPAATFFDDPERENAPVELALALPPGWSAAVALDEVQGAAATYAAPSFDALVDAPIIAGPLEVTSFDAAGTPVQLVNVGDSRRFPKTRATGALQALVREQAAFWGKVPFDRYLFLNVLDSAGGGLEHGSSTLLMFPTTRLGGQKGWRRWLGLASHELFHAWNGKRLRPRVLGPFDLEREAYTRALWFVEGVTSYYDDLLLRRAGLHDDDSYLATLSSALDRLERTPGEEVQSLARSSFDAWIEFYRRDAESTNTAISYYTKGALVAWALDAELRVRSDGKRSLDDVMRAAYGRYSGERGYADEALFEVIAEVGGPEVAEWARRWVETPERLALGRTLTAFGLERTDESKPAPEDELDAEVWAGKKASMAWTGHASEGRWVVDEVLVDGPAWLAGVAPEDEVIALDGDRIPPDGPGAVLSKRSPETKVEITVARRGRLLRLEGTIGVRREKVKIQIAEDASEAAQARRAAWWRSSAAR